MKSIADRLKFAEEILLYAFIWQIPFSWRIIFDQNRSRLSDSFNEYMDISLYLGEIFIIFALVLHILSYKVAEKSIQISESRETGILFHVKQNALFVCIGTSLLSINILLSIDPLLSMVSLLHYALFGIFIYLLIKFFVSRETEFIRNISFILFFSLLIQLIISVIQVIDQSSIGLYFLNESKLFLSGENIAKIHLFSSVYIRGYGTFLHPNILSAYALTVLVFFLSIFKIPTFHVKQRYYVLVCMSSFLVILFSASKIAFLIFASVNLLYLIDKLKLFHVKHRLHFIIFLIIFSISSLIYYNGDAKQSYTTRLDQLKLQSNFTNKEIIIGSGIGTYRISYDKLAVDWWNYEPVHFVPYIVLKELGVLSILLIVIIFSRIIKNVSRETKIYLIPSCLTLTYIISFDHFAWDIYQGLSILGVLFLVLYIDKNRKRLSSINNI